MLMPARVVATLTDAQTRSVVASASGIDAMSRRSPSPMPLCTSAEKPPMKSTPTSRRRGRARRATGVRSSAAHDGGELGDGVTEMRLFTMGMPYSRSICSATGTSRSAARRDVLVDAAWPSTSMSGSAQPRERQPERDGADVEVLLLTIEQCLDDLLGRDVARKTSSGVRAAVAVGATVPRARCGACSGRRPRAAA